MSGFFGIPPFGTAFPPVKGVDQIISTNAGTGATGQNLFFAGANAGQYTSISNLIAIGDDALDAGTIGSPIVDPSISGTIAIGVNSLSALKAPTNNVPATGGGSTVLGTGALQSAQFADSTVAIGSNVGNQYVGNANTQGVSRSVLIGANVMAALPGTQQNDLNTMLGYGILPGSTSIALSNNTLLGGLVAPNASFNMDGCTVIGARAGSSVGTQPGGTNSTVVIGANADTAGNNAVVIGQGATADNLNGGNTVVGSGAKAVGRNNLSLGQNAQNAAVAANDCIVLGMAANPNAGGLEGILCMEYNDGAAAVPHGALFYGSMASGNLIVGLSTNGVDRDFAGVGAINTLKLLNGSKGSINPTAGGYFYVNTATGALRFVGRAGTDTVLAPA